MAYIYTEGGYTIVHLPLISLKNGDVVEETLELKIDPSGVVSGPFNTIQDAYGHVLGRLQRALGEAEDFLDRLEYRLEIEERVKPSEVYTATRMAHVLHHAALHIYNVGRELWRRGLLPTRQLNYSKSLLKKAHYIKRYARDIRILYTSLLELSFESSMRRLAILGTVAVPALLITSFYGMNLNWLPLADNPPAVFLILAAVTSVFALIINKW
ncbi:MAG: CorA family divalent cation transporter [Pyrobaculum sp.]